MNLLAYPRAPAGCKLTINKLRQLMCMRLIFILVKMGYGALIYGGAKITMTYLGH